MVRCLNSAQPVDAKTVTISSHFTSFSCSRWRRWHGLGVQPQPWFCIPCRTCPICSRLSLYVLALGHRLLHASTHLHAAFRIRTICTWEAVLLRRFLHLAFWFHCHFIAPFYHFTLLAQYAADILPLAIFFACRALNALLRFEPSGEPLTPC